MFVVNPTSKYSIPSKENFSTIQPSNCAIVTDLQKYTDTNTKYMEKQKQQKDSFIVLQVNYLNN